MIGIVGGENAVAAEAVELLAEMRCTCKHIVTRLTTVVADADLMRSSCHVGGMICIKPILAAHQMNIANALDMHYDAKQPLGRWRNVSRLPGYVAIMDQRIKSCCWSAQPLTIRSGSA
ncbi:hypothetical protein NKJ81_31785 [Mesorhizobium sp. M0018]|uniref:hypothetical protein n=1 Tax=unclassified Mesorhizobium TaxID=325217 RepID=UPI003338A37A